MSKKNLEGETGLEPCSAEVYPDAVIKVRRDQYSTFEIKRMIEETEELVLAPPFQRKKVWTVKQKRELVESLLVGIPIPVIYVFEDEFGIKQMVDGRQRTSAIIDFMNGEYALDNLKMLPKFDGARFSDLPPLYRGRLERYQLLVYVIEPPTPEQMKYDIFDRVNRGGTRLNNQEMRNALYTGQSTELLRVLSNLHSFKQATGRSIKAVRMRDQYVILRFLAFYLWRIGQLDFAYRNNLDDLLATAMRYLNKAESLVLEDLSAVFDKAMQQAFDVLGEDVFRFPIKNTHRRPINMALFESLAYFFAILPNSCRMDAVAEQVSRIKQEFDSGDYFRSRVDTNSSIEYRFSEVEKLKDMVEC